MVWGNVEEGKTESAKPPQDRVHRGQRGERSCYKIRKTVYGQAYLINGSL